MSSGDVENTSDICREAATGTSAPRLFALLIANHYVDVTSGIELPLRLLKPQSPQQRPQQPQSGSPRSQANNTNASEAIHGDEVPESLSTLSYGAIPTIVEGEQLPDAAAAAESSEIPSKSPTLHSQ